jgi:A/G-specific adenine glycosylase
MKGIIRRSCAQTMNEGDNIIFRKAIYAYYKKHPRPFSWRETTDPYHILVSEVMLQQTQVERVQAKYPPFVIRFPDIPAIAGASLKSVLELWLGLGYNQRAMNLREASKIVMEDYNGVLPDSQADLIRLPGIGKATAGAIQAFAFNKPVLFIETNIRRVYIYFFFQDRSEVTDQEILTLVEATLDRENPRHWYYALMDYGAMLKTKVPNPNRKSAHYTRQARFEGSDRQLRGAIIRHLLTQGASDEGGLIAIMGTESARVRRVLLGLEKDGFIQRSGSQINIR